MEKRIQCINGCGAAAVFSTTEETLVDRIELPVNGNVVVCRADGRCWLEYCCENCMSMEHMIDFVRKGTGR